MLVFLGMVVTYLTNSISTAGNGGKKGNMKKRSKEDQIQNVTIVTAVGLVLTVHSIGTNLWSSAVSVFP